MSPLHHLVVRAGALGEGLMTLSSRGAGDVETTLDSAPETGGQGVKHFFG